MKLTPKQIRETFSREWRVNSKGVFIDRYHPAVYKRKGECVNIRESKK